MTVDEQDLLRQKLNQYIEVNGIKAKKIASDINLDAGCLSRFRKSKVLLWPETYEKLKQYIDNKL